MSKKIETFLEDMIDDDQYDEIEKPKHYNKGGIETYDYIKDVLGERGTLYYCWGNFLKYTGHRLLEKGIPTANASKAMWYLRKVRELLQTTEGKKW